MTARSGFARVAPPLAESTPLRTSRAMARARRLRRLMLILGAIIAAPVVLALFIANLREGGRR